MPAVAVKIRRCLHRFRLAPITLATFRAVLPEAAVHVYDTNPIVGNRIAYLALRAPGEECHRG
jgi:hypothetical protein